MGLFDGVLLVTDLDDTLLDSRSQITNESMDVIEHFKKEGGLFSFITGRIPASVMPYVDMVKPNVPIGCLNGGLIYDHVNKTNIYTLPFKNDVREIIRFIYDNIPYAGIEVVTDGSIFCVKYNEYVDYHRKYEKHSLKMIDIDETGEIMKVFLAMHSDNTKKFQKTMKEKYNDTEFEIVRSHPNFVEILPPDNSKGNLLLKMRELLADKIKMMVAVGDNDNDALMIKYADIGFAVANATTKSKNAADYITVSNDENAIADIIYGLESGKYTRRNSK